MSFLDFPDDDPKRRNRRPLLLFVLGTLVVGALGSAVSEPNIHGWYDGLIRPGFAPPDGVFAPVWTALYVLIAGAAWRVWRAVGLKTPALGAYAVQLALNLGWCVIFFGLHQIGAALAEIVILWLAVLMVTVLFWRADRLAGLMLLPYLAWTGFAAILNHGFWALNP
jgi:translocator protein